MERTKKDKKLYESKIKAVQRDIIKEDELTYGIKESFLLLKKLILSNIKTCHKGTNENFEKAINY